jgi:putative nucleotidyltransferase with HDIG domain
MTMGPAPDAPALDPLPLIRGFASLRRLTGIYPSGHPVVAQKVDELHQMVQHYLRTHSALTLDIIQGDVHQDGISFRGDTAASAQGLREFTDLGVDSLYVRHGVEREEIQRAGEFLADLKEGAPDDPIESRLAARGIRHIRFGRIVRLDTGWRAQQWPDGPAPPLDAAYAESLAMAEGTFDTVSAGRPLDAVTIRDLVKLLMGEVARSNAALGQILTLKEYENLTYCHSVNVAILSLLLGKQLALDEATLTVLVEAALLHDIGKTRIPLEVVKKPGKLDAAEWKFIHAHPTLGAEILVRTPGLHPLTPTVALEHHRGVKGDGYPDLGDGVVPHIMSQIVSVADIYEAVTGARTYREPMRPEQACLVLAREAGTKLNTALVKAFVAAVTFFPVGSLVRTNREETGIVVRTNPQDPLHPVLSLVDQNFEESLGEVDTCLRDGSGAYERQIIETLSSRGHRLDLTRILTTSQGLGTAGATANA